VLVANGRDVRPLPLGERKSGLHDLVDGVPGIQFVSSLESHGEALFDQAVKLDLEGIVGTRL